MQSLPYCYCYLRQMCALYKNSQFNFKSKTNNIRTKEIISTGKRDRRNVLKNDEEQKPSFLSVKCVNCIYADIFLRYILEHNQTSRMATKMEITCACGANRCLSFWRLYVWPFFIRCHCSLFSILFVWQNAVPSSIFKKKKSQL